jgi:O-antigen ligase
MAFACLDFFFQFPAAPGHSLQFIWLDSGVYRRAQGVFYESSTLGNLSVFVLVMIVAAWLDPRINIVAKPWLLLGSIPIVVALLMSYSRGSLASLSVALVCLAVIKGRWSQWKRAIGIAAPVLAVSLIAAFVISPPLASVVWLRMAASLQYFWTSPDAVLSGRLNNWIALVNYMADEPWKLVLGVGYKTLSISGISDSPLIADNTYLSVLIETGIFGLAALVALNFAIVRRAYRAARSRNPQQSFFGTWIFCFWMGETVQMLSGDLLTYWRILPAFFCIVALAGREFS